MVVNVSLKIYWYYVIPLAAAAFSSLFPFAEHAEEFEHLIYHRLFFSLYQKHASADYFLLKFVLREENLSRIYNYNNQ